MNLIIDEEFKNLLPKLSKDEYSRLEEQIKSRGVLNPLIVWNGIIVDGHNRYSICKANNISFEVKEVNFSNKDDVKAWILKHQLGRRNLTDFAKNEIALKYEQVIAEQMRKRQATSTGGSKPQLKTNWSEAENTTKRKELATIAGTSEGSMQRTKLILKKGTAEQIERARKGGSEEDGRSNSINAIANEIKRMDANNLNREKSETQICRVCGQELPIKKFARTQRVCNACRARRDKNTRKYTDFLGNEIKSADIGITEDELKDMLYNSEREVNYTIDDLIEEVRINGENAVESIRTSLKIHDDLLSDKNNRLAMSKVIDDLKKQLNSLMEVQNGTI